MQYKRNPKCECSAFKDIFDFSFEDLRDASTFQNTSYWKDGFIYDKGKSWECSCHYIYRKTEMYNLLAKAAFGELPGFEWLSKHPYVGNNESYAKLLALPDQVNKTQIEDIVALILGFEGTQKTTSIAKLIHKLILQDKTVQYVDFSTVIAQIDKDAFEYTNPDYFIVDNCFDVSVVNFKRPYAILYNLILKRKQPTILVANYFSREDIVSNNNEAWKNVDMLKRIFTQVDKYNTELRFEDVIEKSTLLAEFNNSKDFFSL